MNKGVLGVDMYELCVNIVVFGVNPVSHIIFHIFKFLLVYSDSCVSPLCARIVLFSMTMVIHSASIVFVLYFLYVSLQF